MLVRRFTHGGLLRWVSRDRSLEALSQRGAEAVPLGKDSIVAHLGARHAVGTEATVALELGRRDVANDNRFDDRGRANLATCRGISGLDPSMLAPIPEGRAAELPALVP